MRSYFALQFLLISSGYYRLYCVSIEIAQTLSLALVHENHWELEMSIEATCFLYSLTQNWELPLVASDQSQSSDLGQTNGDGAMK